VTTAEHSRKVDNVHRLALGDLVGTLARLHAEEGRDIFDGICEINEKSSKRCDNGGRIDSNEYVKIKEKNV